MTCNNCKWRKQGEGCVHCSQDDAKMYKAIRKPCKVCGREPGMLRNGCGACIGRGLYIYWAIYNKCDCNGFEPNKPPF